MTTAPFGSSHSPTALPRSVWGQVKALHIVVIALSLVMTIGAWQYSVYQIKNRIGARFDVARDNTVELIRDGMQRYEDALWAGVSAMTSHGNDMSVEQWRTFAHRLRIDEKYPGINGIGVIHFLTADDVPAYMAKRRAERADYAVFPDHDFPIRMPISFIEPEAINAQAVGLDVAHELNRRTAALASRDTGLAQITGPITLVQDSGHTPGFLFYAPYYRQGVQDTVQSRQDNILGAVYAPFVVRKLMAGLLAKDLRDVHFSITDAGQIIYNEHEHDDVRNDPDPMFSEAVTIELYGRSWVLDLRSDLDFRAANTYAQPTVILLGGLLIEALIIAMLVMMSRANGNAVAYADRVTAELRAEKIKLAMTNQELEQFAYVASHDLKTPIRGIGGLAEMLREDLEEYLESPSANPDISRNLDRIEDRVARMSELTRGIMDYSRISASDLGTPPLSLPEAVEAMTGDFDLKPGQLELHSEVTEVTADPFNLRRVLENLVGNAVKYHDGKDPLKITISTARVPERLQIEVTDNGPGIDPKFHARIFEVFQTLRDPNAPESTGIGLAIVQKLVERQGGAISLISSPGQGATFRFDWPMKKFDPTVADMNRAA